MNVVVFSKITLPNMKFIKPGVPTSRFSRFRGFTLIELLVVIAIIAILTAIVLSNFGAAKAKSRDSARISDLGQIQLALTLYFDRCRVYPAVSAGTVDTTSNCQSSGTNVKFVPDFISQVPKDPSTNNSFDYAVNSGRSSYVLRAKLESSNSVLKSSIQSFPSGYLPAFTCNVSSLEYCIGPKQ